VISVPKKGILTSIAERSHQTEANNATARSLQWNTIVVVTTACGLLLVFYGLWLTRVALLIVFAGLLVALGLGSVCTFIESRTHLRRRWSLPFVLVTAVFLLTIGVWVRGTAIENEIDRLQTSLPQAASAFLAQLRAQAWGQWLLTHGFGAGGVPRIMEVLPKVSGVVGRTLGFAGGLAIVLFLGIVIAAEPKTYLHGFERLFPSRAQAYINYVLGNIANDIRIWLVARFASMCAVGFLVFIGLWILRVPMAGTLGLLAALLTFIPNIGPVLSAIPPILLAFTISPRHAALVVLLFWAVHLLEGLLITPVAERTMVRLPPGLTLSVQLVLALLAGGLGIALAAPITIVGMVLIRTVYQEKILSS
jgi:predicted PurR-regulated permease PerM